MEEILKEAEERLADAVENGTASDRAYWRGYRDCAERMIAWEIEAEG